MDIGGKRSHTWLIAAFFVIVLAFMEVKALGAPLNVERLNGSDRYETAEAISKKGWPESSRYAVIVREDSFADALTAGPLAKMYNAPILLTKTDKLNSITVSEIKRLGVSHVIVVGGKSAVSDSVMQELRKLGINDVDRINGRDRFETSVKIAERLGTSNEVILSTDNNFPDALSTTMVAVRMGMPILLTTKEKLPDVVKDYIEGSDVDRTYVIGGRAVISSQVEEALPNVFRLGGKDRYETNITVLGAFEGEFDFNNIFAATGYGEHEYEYVDAVIGAALAARTSSPFILLKSNLPKVTKDYLSVRIRSNSKITVLGGGSAVSSESIKRILDEIMPLPEIKSIAGDMLGDYRVTKGVKGVFGNHRATDAYKIKGTLYVNPGKDGAILIQNLTVDNIVLESGREDFVTLKNVKITGNLRIAAINQAEKVGVTIEGSTNIGATQVESQAVLNRISGSFGKVEISPGSLNKQVDLIGDLRDSAIIVNGIDTVLNLPGNAVIKKIDVRQPSYINIGEGAGINTMYAKAPVEVSGNGTINKLEVVKSGQSIKIKNTFINEVLVTENASNTEIKLSHNALIGEILMLAPTQIKGSGSINTARVNSKGCSIEQVPKKTIMGKGMYLRAY